jgi:hypothetical protein
MAGDDGVTDSVEQLIVSPISRQLDDGIRDEHPSDTFPAYRQNPTFGSIARTVPFQAVKGAVGSFRVFEFARSFNNV